MTISCQYLDDDRVAIRPSERFDFHLYREFRDAYRHTDGLRNHYHVDLSGVRYLDSAALGMLLILRQHAGDRREKVAISGARGAVRELLDLACFPELFEMDDPLRTTALKVFSHRRTRRPAPGAWRR